MELVRRQIHANSMGKPVVDQFFIDDDYNVPDSKGDIARVVMSRGVVKVEEMKRMENYIRVSGKIHFNILYVTEEGEPALESLEGKRPFEEMVYVEENGTDQFVLRNARVEFTASVIHSRKLNIKAMAEIEIGTERIADCSLTTDVEDEGSLYKKRKEMQVLQMHTSKKDTYRIKEEVVLPGTKENIGNLLWTDISSRKLDTRVGDGELNLTGELMVFCFYESQEGKIDWVEQSISYNGRVECSGVDESMYHHVYATLEDVNVDVRMDEDGEMRSIGIEGTLELRINIYEEENVDILEDAYSLEKECRLETEDAVCEELVLQNHSKCKITEQLSLPELRDDILQICHNSGELQIERMEPVEEGIQIEGVLHLKFLYVKENDEVPFDVWQGMVPFSYLLDCENIGENALFDIQHALEQLSVSLLGSGEVEVKAVLAFHSFIRRPVTVGTITNVSLEPLAMDEISKRPGIIGYMVKDGDELWDLAKRYSTTVEGIRTVNALESDKIKEGDRILIFKENMSIL